MVMDVTDLVAWLSAFRGTPEGVMGAAYLAGALGGMAGILVGYPYDTVKVQMQIHQGPHHTLTAINKIKQQGLSGGFFRGLSFPLVSYGAINSVFFGVYNQTLQVLHRDPLGQLSMPSLWTVFCAGCVGGAAQLFIACPSELVKVVLQSQIGNRDKQRYYAGPRQCIKHILKTHGFFGLYRGFGTMALRDIPGMGMDLVVFECLDRYMHHHGYTDAQGIFSNVMAGGISGSVSWALIMPFDVIKSRVQADEGGKYKGSWDCAVRSFREEGPTVFYRGLFMSCVRGFPAAAVTFLVYAQSLKYFNKQQSSSSSPSEPS